MLVDLSIIPVCGDGHTSGLLADVLKMIDDSKVRYQLTPTGTCLEGDWEQVMGLVRRCHEYARSKCVHVVTTIRVEDHAGVVNQLHGNVDAVVTKAGRPLMV